MTNYKKYAIINLFSCYLTTYFQRRKIMSSLIKEYHLESVKERKQGKVIRYLTVIGVTVTLVIVPLTLIGFYYIFGIGDVDEDDSLTDSAIVARSAIISAKPEGTLFPMPLRVFTNPEPLPCANQIRFFARISDMREEYIEVYAPAGSQVRKGQAIQAISYRQRRSLVGEGYRFVYFLYSPPSETCPPL